MAMTLDELKRLVDGCKLRYFVDPRQPALMLGMGGMCGSFQAVIHLDVDGRFLQVRTFQYLHCPPGHPNGPAVLGVLAALNHDFRLVKFALDPQDGEIVAYADAWIEDGRLTQAQFTRMLDNFFPTVDMSRLRIRAAMETGRDPGRIDSPDALQRAMAGAGGPPVRFPDGIGGSRTPPPGPPVAPPTPGGTPGTPVVEI